MASTHLAKEVATQPVNWTHVANRVASLSSALPRTGERIATIGCGTSWFMGQAYAARRESLGLGPSDAYAASENRLARGYDRAVVISRSGTTTEVVQVVRQLRASGTPFVSIVATPDCPVAQLSDDLIVLTEVDEESVVQTRFATTVLALLRASLGENLSAAVEQAHAALGSEIASELGPARTAEQVTFLGQDYTVGIAHEAALKLRESAQFWTESYPAMEYRHGPISVAAPGRVVWCIGEPPPGLAEEVRATGASFMYKMTDPLVDLVRVHRLCLDIATRRGVDPDRPRHLSRSIVLA